MTGLSASPAILLAAVLALVGGCLIVLAWGRKIPRQGDWLVSLGLLAVLVVGGIGWSLLAEQAFAPEEWVRGWIWPRDEIGAITIGVLRDPIGVTMSILTALVAAATLIGAGAQGREARAGRFYAALGLSTAGVSLAWFALTPWLALTGIALVIFGGFLSLGSRWDMPVEAGIATRFGWERSWGLILSLLGLCVLAGGRVPLSMLHAAGAGGWTAQAGGHATSDYLGALLLFIGSFAQLQPFPLLGWLMSPSDTHSPARIVVAQVFPAWATFALLVRLEPQLREIGVFPDLGWLGLASAVLAAVAGVMSSQWRSGLGAWIASGFSLAVAALAFAGVMPAYCLVVGLGLGSCALAGFAAALEEGGPANNTGKQRALAAKIGCAFAAAAGTGFFGFVSAGGNARLVSLAWAQPALAGAVAAVFFLFIFLGWKVAWQMMAIKPSTQAKWSVVLAPYLLIILALGSVWTGTLSGSAIPGNPDRVFHSMLALFFGPSGESWGEEPTIAAANGVYWLVSLVASGAALFTVGRNPDFWPGVMRSLPRFTTFVISGYGVDSLLMRVRTALAWIGQVSARFFDRSVWESWLPIMIGRGAQRSAAAIAQADLRLSRGIGGMLRRWVDTPARALQFIQNGDVQWYLFFAVGSGIAILAHFMMTKV